MDSHPRYGELSRLWLNEEDINRESEETVLLRISLAITRKSLQ
jgi:hypothetical protein